MCENGALERNLKLAIKKRKTGRKQTKKQKQQMTARIIGIVLIILSLAGGFHLGNMGLLLANCFRIFLGDAYQLGALFVVFVGAYMLISAREPRVKVNYLGGGILVTASVILFLSTYLFGRLDLHTDFLTVTWQYLKSDIISNSVGSAVGGGLLGAFLYQITYFLLAQIGSYVIAALLMLGGGCLILGISFGKVVDFLGLSLYEILKFFKQVGLWLTDLFKKSGPWLKRRRNSLHDKVQQDYFEDTKQGQDNTINEKVKDEGLTATELSADEPTETVTIENDINDDKNLPPAHSTDDPALWNEQSSQNSQKNVREIQPKPTNPDYELPDASLLQDVAPTDQSQEKKV